MPEDNETHGMGVLKYLILIVLVTVVVLLFFSQVLDVFSSRVDTQICRRSIEIASNANVRGVDAFATAQSLKCPPTYETIIHDSDDMIKKKIADQMAECFWKFGENKYELFGTSVFKEEHFCALCSHIKFDGASKGKKINDFGEFLAKEPVPKKYGPGVSYMDYVIGRPTDAAELDQLIQQGNIEINTDEDYGIMFVYVKNSHVQKIWASTIGATVGTGSTLIGGIAFLLMAAPDITFTKLAGLALISVAGGAAGATAGNAAGSEKSADWQSGVLLIPYDEHNLNILNCTQMPFKQGNK